MQGWERKSEGVSSGGGGGAVLARFLERHGVLKENQQGFVFVTSLQGSVY